MRYAVSVTVLEQFNRYLCGRSSMSQLLDSAFERGVQTMQMELGTTFHKVLEDPQSHRYIETFGTREHVYYGLKDRLAMTQETLDQALAYVPVLGLRELKGQSMFRMDDGNTMIVNMRLDHIIGSTIIDHKSKWNKSVSEYEISRVIEQYEDSMQGLYYMHAFQADIVQYIIYWMSHTHPLAEIQHIQSITLNAPAGLEAKLEDHTRHFYEWAGNVGLHEKLIKRAERTPIEIF